MRFPHKKLQLCTLLALALGSAPALAQPTYLFLVASKGLKAETPSPSPTPPVSPTPEPAPEPTPEPVPEPEATPVAFLASEFYSGGNWATSLAVSNSYLTPDGRGWVVNARPASGSTKQIYMQSQPTFGNGVHYAELTATTHSAWVGIRGASDGLVHAVALDGPACTRFSSAVSNCTSNASGWGHARLGLTMNFNNGAFTLQVNGVNVFTSLGLPTNQGYKVWVLDRDSPANANSRTFTLHGAKSSWQYAPAGAVPFTPAN